MPVLSRIRSPPGALPPVVHSDGTSAEENLPIISGILLLVDCRMALEKALDGLWHVKRCRTITVSTVVVACPRGLRYLRARPFFTLVERRLA